MAFNKMHKMKILCWDAHSIFFGVMFKRPCDCLFCLTDAGRGCAWGMKGSVLDQQEGKRGETSAVRLTKTPPAQLHLWPPSLRWSPRQKWRCSCGWARCRTASGSQSCSVRVGKTDLGSDWKSGITAKYSPGLSDRGRIVGQWWLQQRAHTKAPQHRLILKAFNSDLDKLFLP